MTDELTLDIEVPAEEAGESVELDNGEVQGQEEAAPVVDAPAGPSVPALVSKHSPGMAAIWNDLSAEHRASLMGDIAARLDAQHAEDQEPDKGNQDDVGVVSSQQGQVAPRTGAPTVPEPMPQEDRTILIDAVGGADSPEGRAMKRLFDREDQWSKFYDATAKLVVGSLDEQDTRVDSLIRERQLEQALVAQGDSLEGMSQPDVEAVAERANELVKTGRVADFGDAVSLALMQVGKKGTVNPSGAKRRTAALAASATSSPRRNSPAKGRIPSSLDDAMDMARAEVGD